MLLVIEFVKLLCTAIVNYVYSYGDSTTQPMLILIVLSSNTPTWYILSRLDDLRGMCRFLIDGDIVIHVHKPIMFTVKCQNAGYLLWSVIILCDYTGVDLLSVR